MATKTKRPGKKKDRLAKSPSTVPGAFRPKFWEDADNRQTAVRRIRERYEQLKAEAGGDSVAFDLLAQRAAFISLKLQTLEIDALETGVLNESIYATLLNSFCGVLTRLTSIPKKVKTTTNLADHIASKYGHADDEGDDD